MRPTDENQNASNRPNLMSSPHGGGSEENILAMLERDAGSRPSPTARIAWYGTAGLVVIGLIGALVWLVRDNPANRALDKALATVAPPAASAPAQASTAAMAVSVPAEVHAHAQGAAIIDNPEAAPVATARAQAPATVTEDAARAAPVPAPSAQPEPPPLVLLSPEEAAEARGETVARQARPEPVDRAREAPPEPDTHLIRPENPLAARADPPPARVAAKAARPPSQSRAKERTTAAKPRKNAPAPAAEEAVDRDVALISAIIMHSSRHAAEREAAAASKQGQ